MRFLRIMPLFVVLVGCQEDNSVLGTDTDLTWTIDTDYMRQGCYAGKDCIPSLQHPNRSSADGANLGFLDDGDRVVGVWNGSEYVAYPHSILDWHEIVNEDGYTISYCPLTGSAIHSETESQYGVSGLLFNSNLIMYDRTTDSYWPQMLLRSAAGTRSGSTIQLQNLVETSWGNWKALFPNTKVINSRTGFSRNYSSYPYGTYRTCNSPNCGDYIYFPVANTDDRLDEKDRVFVLLNGDWARAIPIDAFSDPQVLAVDISGKRHKVFVSGSDDIAVAFETVRDIRIEIWDLDTGEIVLKQAGGEGRWDITGRHLDSDAPGDQLKAANGYIAFWFSVAAFYPDVEIVTG